MLCNFVHMTVSQYTNVSETFTGTCSPREEYTDSHVRCLLLLMLLYSSLWHLYNRRFTFQESRKQHPTYQADFGKCLRLWVMENVP